jgi:hypothetical protein
VARRNPTPAEPQVPGAAMARHIKQLGLAGVSAYLAWCAEAGIAQSLDKSPAEREREVEQKRARDAAAAARATVHRNPRKFIAEACAGRIVPAQVERPGWREVATAIAGAKSGEGERESLAEFLLHLERSSDLVFASTTVTRQPRLYLDGLIRLHERRRLWLRDLKTWRAGSHNAHRQFASLARHLLAKYDVPAFLDEAWLRGDRGAYRYRDWFVHIGRGHNIRTAKTPYPMTKMIAHHFVHAPADASIEAALMYADIKALDGGGRLAAALMGTRLGQRVETDAERRAFWLSVYRFFIANPMLDLRHAGPIVDFLNAQKFETREVVVGPGRVETRTPPQPNLTMNRRTPESLLRQVDAWHGELRKGRGADTRFWRSSGIAGLEMQTGPRNRPEERVHWRLRELLSGAELVEEGRRLRHCVSSYADSCAKGACSIWSLERRETSDHAPERLLTVEVDKSGTVVQARGRANRWPTEQEKAVLTEWMRTAGLRSGPYLYGW